MKAIPKKRGLGDRF